MKVLVSDRSAAVENLLSWAVDAGRAREEYMNAIYTIPEHEVSYVCTYGRGTAYAFPDGRALTRKEVEALRSSSDEAEAEEEDDLDDETYRFLRAEVESAVGDDQVIADFLTAATSGFIHENLRVVPPGAAPLNKVINVDGAEIHIPCGVCVLLGSANAGKTPLAHLLASSGVESYSIVRAGEPFAGYLSNQHAIAAELARAMHESSDIVLDSAKDLLSGEGAAMKGGLSRGVLLDLSIWSALAAAIGCTIYVPLNPSSEDPEILAMLREAAVSNTTMTIAKTFGDTWDYISRTGEGLPRRTGAFQFKRDGGSRSPSRSGKSSTSLSARVQDDKFTESVLMRVIRNHHQ